jgi:hypothetical protein
MFLEQINAQVLSDQVTRIILGQYPFDPHHVLFLRFTKKKIANMDMACPASNAPIVD